MRCWHVVFIHTYSNEFIPYIYGRQLCLRNSLQCLGVSSVSMTNGSINVASSWHWMSPLVARCPTGLSSLPFFGNSTQISFIYVYILRNSYRSSFPFQESYENPTVFNVLSSFLVIPFLSMPIAFSNFPTDVQGLSSVTFLQMALVF